MTARNLILLICGLPLCAQPQPVSPANAAEQATIEALLKSSDLGQLAWGAQLVANYQQKKFIPEVIALLDSPNRDVQLSALDALIRLNADVPEESLAKFLNGGHTLEPAIVFLARDPKAHAGFLVHALDRTLFDQQWVAVSSFLAAAPPPGYASRLLRDWTIKATVEVKERPGGVGYGGPSGCGDGRGRVTPDAPMIPYYTIAEGLQPGATLIAAGPHPISYLRQDSPHDCRPLIDRDAYRLDYLLYLAHIDPQTPEGRLPPAPVFPWAGPKDYLTKASAYLDSLRVFVANLRSQLTRAGLLAASEAPSGPALEIMVIDGRLDRSVPLPAVDWGI